MEEKHIIYAFIYIAISLAVIVIFELFKRYKTSNVMITPEGLRKFNSISIKNMNKKIFKCVKRSLMPLIRERIISNYSIDTNEINFIETMELKGLGEESVYFINNIDEVKDCIRNIMDKSGWKVDVIKYNFENNGEITIEMTIKQA